MVTCSSLPVFWHIAVCIWRYINITNYATDVPIQHLNVFKLIIFCQIDEPEMEQSNQGNVCDMSKDGIWECFIIIDHEFF